MTKYVVMYSGGVGSWASTKRLLDTTPKEDVTLLFADTKIEDEDLYRFLDETSQKLGVNLVKISDGRTPWDVFHDKRWLGNSRVAQCSHLLKQAPSRKWMEANAKDSTVVVGIDWTEIHRLEAIKRHWAPWEVIAPLCGPPYVSKKELFKSLSDDGIEIPKLYKMGFSHNNCGGFCVRAGVGHFAQLYKNMPERYLWHEANENALREYLQKDVAILRRVRNGEKIPLTLEQLRRELDDQKQVDMLDIGGCGCWV